jgi:hypothetical protein
MQVEEKVRSGEGRAMRSRAGSYCIRLEFLILTFTLGRSDYRKKTQHFSSTKSNLLTLFKEIIAVYIENNKKSVNTLSEDCRITDCLVRGVCSYHWALNGKDRRPFYVGVSHPVSGSVHMGLCNASYYLILSCTFDL